MKVYVAKRTFKSVGIVYTVGSVIADPSCIRLFKTKLKDGKIIEVTESNLDKIAEHVLVRTGVDVRESLVEVFEAAKEVKAAEEAVRIAAEELAKAEEEAWAAEELAKAEEAAAKAEEEVKAAAEAKVAEEAVNKTEVKKAKVTIKG